MKYRVLRGGAFFNPDSWYLSPTDCSGYVPVNRSRNIGFRLVVRRRKP